MVVTEPKSKDLASQCVAIGMRMAEQRCIIARVHSGSTDHPEVEELYRRCSGGRARYEQMRESHHDHLVNLCAGEVIESQSEDIERSQAEIAKKLGYRLIDHRLELYAVPLDNKAKR
jgi:Fur family ferric uptake transcriptional regulator